MTARLRHFAISVPDPQKAASFYEKALGMTRVGENDHPGATAIYLTDGTVNLALLRYKTEQAAGGDPDRFGVHHFGFVVDDVEAVQGEIEAAGGNWLMGEAKGGRCVLRDQVPRPGRGDLRHQRGRLEDGGGVDFTPPPHPPAPRRRA